MTRKIGNIIQAVLLSLQTVNVAVLPISANAKIWISVITGMIQFIIGNIQQSFNPDGTPAETAYIPPKPSAPPPGWEDVK